MVITRLSGGLGNQLFQYAAGRALSLARGVPLALDTAPLKTVAPGLTPRQYALGELRINARLASATEIASLNSKSLWKRVVNRFAPVRFRSAYFEKSHAFDPNVLRLSGDVYIAGHWQSERYFSTASSQIREELKLQAPLSAASNVLVTAIGAARHPVSIHVRRGDYVSNSAAAKHHGVLDVRYYQRAVREIMKSAPHATFFVFSDDPAWVRENLIVDADLTIVHAEGRTDAEDMILMSLCRAHVISNSSFSWWGAWLSGHPQKKVIGPKDWFASESMDSSDIIPAGWMQI